MGQCGSEVFRRHVRGFCFVDGIRKVDYRDVQDKG
jgi:hypothetical protein